MTARSSIPLGHTIPSHRAFGWCSHCPDRTVTEELAAWQTREPTDDLTVQAAEVDRLRIENERMRHELEVMYGGAFDSPDLATADNPTQLRWGLDDVLHGDDDTTTILLSGPSGKPYWLELEPERTAALRDALAGPGDSTARATALDVLRALADPEPCAWEGVYCVTHSWKSDIGRCPHGQAQVLLGGGR